MRGSSGVAKSLSRVIHSPDRASKHVGPNVAPTPKCRRYLGLMDRTARVWSHASQEDGMKPVKQVSCRVISRLGVVVAAPVLGDCSAAMVKPESGMMPSKPRN